MMTDTTPTKRKTPRWVKILLTLSLALNLLIIGASAARFFGPNHYMAGKGKHSALGQPGAMHHAGRHFMWKLPRERRHEMYQLVKMHRENMKSEYSNLAKTRLAFANMITNQPGNQEDNQERFDKFYAEIKKAEAALHQKASALTKDFIQSLTPSERQAFAKILQDPPKRRWFKKHSKF